MSRNFDLGISGFEISDTDEESNPQYFGFIDRYGNWLIKRLNTISKSLEVRYVRGSLIDPYTIAWTNRASLNYDHYDEVF
jgi:hypothetical protein